MPREIGFLGMLVPGLLPILLACAVLFVGLDLTLSRTGLYRHVWHPSLFRASLFLALFSAAGLTLGR
ncbi:DUF1656 domain-containing protein [Stenotrophomonas sp. TWI602]|uniref:DUF1656 domain-containing protein n=1 Tax=Stenotrophomonas sp. TWI602 TaxID=3136786 RepID=UPI003208BEA6